jgi:ubiquinone biosynthesis protein
MDRIGLRARRRDPEPGVDFLVSQLREGSRGDARAGLRVALRLLDGALQGFERAAWELRGLADDAADLWRAVERDASRVADDWLALRQELADWPARVSRASATAWVLTQVTTSYRFHAARSAFLSEERAARAFEALHARNARRFYQASVRQGGAFLKVGQLLSARMDLLPEPWIAELSKLQDAVPAVPFPEIREAIEEDLGRPLSQLFESFDEEPLAAASIGQVHRAIAPGGLPVAVKVQRPGIEQLIALDMALLEIAVDALKSLFPPSDTETIVAEVRDMIRGELDYANEARMMDRLAGFFAGHPGILVPRSLPELCGERVLTSSFVEGRKITDVLAAWRRLQSAGDSEAERRIGRTLGLLLEAYTRQVLQAGVFQADPHPGNLLVTPDDKLVILDFGCTKLMPDETRDLYLALLQCFVSGDRDRMAGLFEALGFVTESGSADTLHAFAEVLLRSFREAAHGHEQLVWMNEKEIFAQTAELLQISQDDPVIRIPAEFVMLGRVFGTLGGLLHHYRPAIDYSRHLFPVLGEAMAVLNEVGEATSGRA